MDLELLKSIEEVYAELYKRTYDTLYHKHYRDSIENKVTPAMVEKSVSHILNLYQFTLELNKEIDIEELDSALFKYKQDKVV